jgi:DNA invertase Pin-like site-specific DNA recombinase
MAADNGWRVLGEYADEGFSAYSGNRGPELASAREHAGRAAAESGTIVMLLAQAADRFSRGAGDRPGAPRALVEIWHQERRCNVHLRTVQDDEELRTSASVANLGARAEGESRRKSAAVRAGRRRAAEEGRPAGAIPDGYMVEYAGATKARRILLDPERRELWDLVWGMALTGTTVLTIVRELDIRGWRTAPRGGKPKPFDDNRLRKALANPFYAGLAVSRGEVVGLGKWDAYVDPRDWCRLSREYRENARLGPRPVGKPPGGLLAGLARCECGSSAGHRRLGPRKDGSQRRVYVCRTHQGRPDGCGAKPYDAAAVEAIVLDNLNELLGKAGAWDKVRAAARKAERVRLEGKADAAAAETRDHEAASEKLIAAFDAAVLAGDESKMELAIAAQTGRREAAERAGVRHKAATDALVAFDGEPEDDTGEQAVERLWAPLAERMEDAKGDTKALSGVLREFFERFELHDGGARLVPVLRTASIVNLQRENRAAAQRTGGEPTAWPHWSYDRDPADPEHRILTPTAPELNDAAISAPSKERSRCQSTAKR